MSTKYVTGTVQYTPAEAELANAKDYLRDALNRRTNDITRAKRWVREAELALARERDGEVAK